MRRHATRTGLALGVILLLVSTAACGPRVDSQSQALPTVGDAPVDSGATDDLSSAPVEVLDPEQAGSSPGASGGAGTSGAGTSGRGPSGAPTRSSPAQAGGTSGDRSPAATPSATGTAASQGAAGGSQPAAAGGPSPEGGSAQGGSSAPAAEESAYPDAVSIEGPHSQGVTDTEIKIGLAVPLSGVLGFVGNQIVNGVRAYLQSVNDAGGVNGRKYRMIVLDSQFDPALEATAAKRLVEQEEVFSLILTFGDSAAPYVASKGIPDIAFGVTPPTFSSKYPTTYPIGWSTVEMLIAEAYHMTQVLDIPIQTTALLYATQNTPIAKWVDQLSDAWTIWGVDVKSTDPFDFSDGDCTRLVLKMQDLNIDYWALAQTPAWPICQQAMARQNYSPPQGRGGPYTPDANVVGQAGRASDGVWGMSTGVTINVDDGGTALAPSGEPYPWHPSGVAPEIDRYLSTVKKYSPAGDDIENIWTQTFWVGAKLLDEAVKRQTDAVTWKGVNRWIQSQRNFTSGLLPPFSLVPTCKTGAASFMFRWQWDGERLVQTDWREYGGRIEIPTEVKNKITPGGGDCYLTKMADDTLQ